MTFSDIFSSAVMPLIILFVVLYSTIKGTPVLEVFAEGAKRGLITVFGIIPILIALMCASSLFSDSGAADILKLIIKPLTEIIGFPSELVPLMIMKMFSSSAATGLITEIFASFGSDSYIGRTAAVMLSSTETIFYTMSVYFSPVDVKDTRYTLLCCIISTFFGVAASAVITRFI